VRRIGRHRGWRWHLGQEPPVRSAESQRAIGLSIDLIALLVDRPVVPAAEQHEIRERGGTALGPVPDVMPLAEADAAAWEAAAAVAMLERPA
jgi:hypothetical protein